MVNLRDVAGNQKEKKKKDCATETTAREMLSSGKRILQQTEPDGSSLLSFHAPEGIERTDRMKSDTVSVGWYTIEVAAPVSTSV